MAFFLKVHKIGNKLTSQTSMASWLTPFFPCCVNMQAAPLKLDSFPVNRPGIPLKPSTDKPLEPGRFFVLLFPFLPGEPGLTVPLVLLLSSDDNKQDPMPRTRASPSMHSKAAMVQLDSSSDWESTRGSVVEDRSETCCCLDLLQGLLRVEGKERLRWDPGRRAPETTATIKLGSEMMWFEENLIQDNQFWVSLGGFGGWDDTKGDVLGNEFPLFKGMELGGIL
jgi:hypothetical protein